MDSVDTCIFIQLCNRVLIHPAITPEKLYAPVYAVHLTLSDPELCHRRGCGIQFASDEQISAVVYEGLTNGDLSFDVGQ